MERGHDGFPAGQAGSAPLIPWSVRTRAPDSALGVLIGGARQGDRSGNTTEPRHHRRLALRWRGEPVPSEASPAGRDLLSGALQGRSHYNRQAFLSGSRQGPVAVLARLAWGALPPEQARADLAGQINVRHLFHGHWKRGAPAT